MSKNIASIVVCLLPWLHAGGCSEIPSPIVCASGLECPRGSVCTADQKGCTASGCGDGVVDTRAGEVCDDGNTSDSDDCTSICELADCSDGFANGDEGDIDCGGSCGATCRLNQTCHDASDCQSGICIAGICSSGTLTAGFEHTCAIRAGGAVRCWGSGDDGQLGHADTNAIGDNEYPHTAGDIAVGGTVVQIVAGGRHTCALLDTGNVRCWGYGDDGQLGYGNRASIGDDEHPAEAGDVKLPPVIQIAAGGYHTCALVDVGAVRCWGHGSQGRLGHGSTDNIGDDEDPTSPVDVGGTVIQIAAGSSHTCALVDTGKVRCWGWGAYGQLGYGNKRTIGDDEHPASAGDVAVRGTVIQIAAGGLHTCALLDTGKVRCWGNGSDGRLGYGTDDTIGDDEHPAEAGDVNVGGTVLQIAAGGSHTCALLDSGAVRCWGQGDHGRLGYGNSSDIRDAATAEDVPVGSSVIEVHTGFAHTCVRLDTGAIRCWGNGVYGRLGYGNQNSIGDDEPASSAGDVPWLDPTAQQ